jgi:hypothetical protein
MMKSKSVSLVSLALAAIMPVLAQDKSAAPVAASATPTPATSTGLLNDWLRGQSDDFKAWDLGGQIRLRYETKENMAVAGRAGAVDFGASVVDNDNDYFLTRTKLHLGFSPVDWFTAFAEGRHSTAAGDERTPSPDRDAIDLHQAFIALGTVKEFPVTAKIGRQELAYGDERLIGPSDWGNAGRVFDAAKIRFENSDVWVDAFVSQVVMVRDEHFNEANNYDYLSGLYASTRTLIPKQETQLYFLARNVQHGSPNVIGTGQPPLLTGASPRDIYTIGMRVKSLPGQFHGWDYEAEFAGQFGRFQATASSPSLSQEAFAAHVAAGYTWAKTWGAPRAGLEYNYASGDDNPNDGTHGTFDNLFPTNHKFYGFMDFVSWQNIHDARLAASLKPLAKLTVTADYHAFWLADTHDYFYQVNGAPRSSGGYGLNSNAGSFVGTELDLAATYAIKPYASVQAGYGHFFTGDYVTDLLASRGGSQDANWFYAQTTFTF